MYHSIKVGILVVMGLLVGCAQYKNLPPEQASEFRSFRATVSDPLLITRLSPGSSQAEVNKLLNQAGIAGAFSLPSGRESYEAQVIPQIDQRQRLILVSENGQLVKSAVVINFENVGALESNEQLFFRILNTLNKHYGRPDFFYERGIGRRNAFSSNLADDVSNEQFIRVYEWRLDNGVLRFGIPRRLDRDARMEIQFSSPKYLPSFGYTMWSVDESFN